MNTSVGRLGIALILTMLLATVSVAVAQNAVQELPPRMGYAELTRLLSTPSSRLLLLDVRTEEEYTVGHIGGALLYPYDSLKRDFRETDKTRPIVVYCRSGRRSAIAVQVLKEMGYKNVSDFGGIDAWRGILVTGPRPHP